jgi:hypothetical protein
MRGNSPVRFGKRPTEKDANHGHLAGGLFHSRCPLGNCFAERFVRILRAELTDRILIFSQRHLLVVLTEYVRHYNGRRPHRACDLRPPRPTYPVVDLSHERITRRSDLGGLINEYERAA